MHRDEEVIIQDFNAKGKGVGILPSGAQIEVPLSVVGDKLWVMPGPRRGGVHRGAIQEMITPSADRIEPLCKHTSVCGGCSWQQMRYEAQLATKQALVEKYFSPFIEKIEPIIPCDPPWHYRNKMEFSFSQNKEKEHFLGLMMRDARGRVFNLTECHLASPWMAESLTAVRHWWQKSSLLAYFAPKDEGSLRTLTLRETKRTQEKMGILTLSGNPQFALNRGEIDSFVACLERACGEGPHPSLFLRIQQQIKGQETQFFEMHLAGPAHIEEKLVVGEKSFTFKISPTSFFQPNPLQAEKLYAAALQMVGIGPKKVIYDLYCGTATLAILFAHRAEKVIGIELNPHAIFDARENSALNQITNLELIQGDVAEKMGALPPSPDLVVIDPPRMGLTPKALALLIQCAPQEILYIACNIHTQADNIQVLTANGYRVEKVQPVDQFPHTPHIENILLLKKV